VDDATVTIENVERHLAAGGKLEDGILKGAGEIALPPWFPHSASASSLSNVFAGGRGALPLCAFGRSSHVRCSLFLCDLTHFVPTMIMFFERHHHKSEGEQHVAIWVKHSQLSSTVLKRLSSG